MHRRLWTGIATLVTLATFAATAASTARADENRVRGERRARGGPAAPPSSRAPSPALRSLGNPHFSAVSPGAGNAAARSLSQGNFGQGHRVSPFAGNVPSIRSSSATLRPSPYQAPYVGTPRSLGTLGTGSTSFDRLRTRLQNQGLSSQYGSTLGVRRQRDPSPAVDTRLSQRGIRSSSASGAGQPLVGFRRSGSIVSGGGAQPAIRQGSVSYGGGGGLAAATRRPGVVSYGGHSPSALHSYSGHHHHHHGIRSSYWNAPPWWWYRGPRYGFGFGISTYYDPWPWYSTWGFATTVYEPYPVYVPVYVPQEAPPVYVIPGQVIPGQPYPGDVVEPGTVLPEGAVPPPPAPAPLAPPAVEQGPPEATDAAPMDEATRQALEESFEHFRARRYAEAYARLDALVAAHPEIGEAWMGRFYAAFPLGRYGDAARSLARAAALGAFPRGYRFDPRPLYDAPTDTEKPFDAHFARLAAHVNANPSDPNGYAVLAYLYVAMGRTAEAEAALASLRALNPADALALALRTALLPAEEQPAPGQPPVQPPVQPNGGPQSPGFPPPAPFPQR